MLGKSVGKDAVVGMLKVEKIIATVVLNKRHSVDMELPAFLPVSQLSDKVLETLKILAPREFGHVQEIRLAVQGRSLNPQSTLASVGVWDGAILEVIRR